MNIDEAIILSKQIERWNERFVNTKVVRALNELVFRDYAMTPHMAVDRGLFGDKIIYSCPKCERELKRDRNSNYCQECGQHLDWSEAERIRNGHARIKWVLEEE